MTARAVSTLRAPLVIQPREPYFDDTVQFAIDRGFDLEFIHLAHPDELDGCDEPAAQRLLRRVSGHTGGRRLHGPFMDLYVNSPDALIRKVSERRIEQTIELATLLKVEHVIFHTNHLPCTTRPEYSDRWRDFNIAFWSRACASFPGTIVLENMWDDGPGLLRGVLDEVPALRACLDTGHANVFSDVPLARWISVLADRLDYVHLSDNHGTADEALPPGDGTIDWASFNAAITELAPHAAVMVGMDSGGLTATRIAVERMQQQGIHPFGKESDASS